MEQEFGVSGRSNLAPDSRLGETYGQGEVIAGKDKAVQVQTVDTTSAVNEEEIVTISANVWDHMVSTMKTPSTEKKCYWLDRTEFAAHYKYTNRGSTV